METTTFQSLPIWSRFQWPESVNIFQKTGNRQYTEFPLSHGDTQTLNGKETRKPVVALPDLPIILHEDEFMDRFHPELDTNGSLVMREFPTDSELIQAAIESNRIWTALDSEDGMIFVNGHQMVNRNHSVITKIPWNPQIIYEIHFEGETD